MGLPPVHAVSDGELVNDSGWVLRWTVQFQRGTTVPQGPEFIRNLLSAPEGAKVFIRTGWLLGVLPKPRGGSGSDDPNLCPNGTETPRIDTRETVPLR